MPGVGHAVQDAAHLDSADWRRVGEPRSWAYVDDAGSTSTWSMPARSRSSQARPSSCTDQSGGAPRTVLPSGSTSPWAAKSASSSVAGVSRCQLGEQGAVSAALDSTSAGAATLWVSGRAQGRPEPDGTRRARRRSPPRTVIADPHHRGHWNGARSRPAPGRTAPGVVRARTVRRGRRARCCPTRTRLSLAVDDVRHSGNGSASSACHRISVTSVVPPGNSAPEGSVAVTDVDQPDGEPLGRVGVRRRRLGRDRRTDSDRSSPTQSRRHQHVARSQVG